MEPFPEGVCGTARVSCYLKEALLAGAVIREAVAEESAVPSMRTLLHCSFFLSFLCFPCIHAYPTWEKPSPPGAGSGNILVLRSVNLFLVNMRVLECLPCTRNENFPP